MRKALRSEEPPRYQRTAAASKLDPFKDEIHRLLSADPKLPGVRVRELIEPLGFVGGKSIVDDYLGEVPRASEDRVKTDRRDAEGLCRLLAAGGLRFAFVPTSQDGRNAPMRQPQQRILVPAAAHPAVPDRSPQSPDDRCRAGRRRRSG